MQLNSFLFLSSSTRFSILLDRLDVASIFSCSTYSWRSFISGGNTTSFSPILVNPIWFKIPCSFWIFFYSFLSADLFHFAHTLWTKECYSSQLSLNVKIHVIKILWRDRRLISLILLLQTRNHLVQSAAKVHHAQLFFCTKIYSPYSISVATSYCRSIQILRTMLILCCVTCNYQSYLCSISRKS